MIFFAAGDRTRAGTSDARKIIVALAVLDNQDKIEDIGKAFNMDQIGEANALFIFQQRDSPSPVLTGGKSVEYVKIFGITLPKRAERKREDSTTFTMKYNPSFPERSAVLN